MSDAAALVQRVSVATGGGQASGGGSLSPALSSNGRFVAFDSEATNLVPGDTNGVRDVFMYDRQLGQTERVSVASDGTQGNDSSFAADISADGRYVAFLSYATNLVTGTSQGANVFVRDRQLGTTERISPIQQPSVFDFFLYLYAQVTLRNEVVSISDDGRFVAYPYVGEIGNPSVKTVALVYDRQTGLIEYIKVPTVSPDPSDPGDASLPSALTAPTRVTISGDGRLVAFDTYARLVGGDLNKQRDVYVYDRQTGVFDRASVSTLGAEGNGYSAWPTLSRDGRFVAYASEASNLDQGDPFFRGVFLRDRQAETTTRIDASAAAPSISGDGRWIAYAHLLCGSEEPGCYGPGVREVQIYLFDRLKGTKQLISRIDDQTAGNGAAFGAAVSADGKIVAFASQATDLASADTNGNDDVFVAANGAAAGFTDDSLIGVPVKAVHITELRLRIDGLRTQYGLAQFGSTDPALIPGYTVRAVHVQELRAALNEVYTAANKSSPTYTDSVIVANSTVIKATHIAELRAAVIALE